MSNSTTVLSWQQSPGSTTDSTAQVCKKYRTIIDL